MTQEMERAEGKTKIILHKPGTDWVQIINKDDITAGDGVRREVMAGKGVLATDTASNCFCLLNDAGVPTHFFDKLDEVSFQAAWVDMIPLEVVARRIAYGSYLKRNPEVRAGKWFDHLVVELYLKDDARHDPYVRYGSKQWMLYDAKRPLDAGPIDAIKEILTARGNRVSVFHTYTLCGLAQTVFTVLEDAWARQNVELVDLKIEGGFQLDAEGSPIGLIMVADDINNDSWRIWPNGVAAAMLDKQRFRDQAVVTPEFMDSLKRDYAKVAEMTYQFLVL